MVYVALLRGVNVGGKNKIDMKLLKDTFERVGMKSVNTYINSGNVIFIDEKRKKQDIPSLLEKGIYEDFDLDVKVIVRSLDDFEDILKILPRHWKNDSNMKGDVLFLWDEMDKETLQSTLLIKPNIDTVLFAPGVILWSVGQENVAKSGLMKLVGMEIYKKMTIRNVNTTRKIYEIMKELNINSGVKKGK